MNCAHTEFKNSTAGRNPIRDGIPMLIVVGALLAAVVTLAIRCV
jgi:hypothetical protein